ncbi:MAG: FAD-dependent oxidoreductase [archaeon]|nr:FAD-dependent oxidoreductase [archaeon]
MIDIEEISLKMCSTCESRCIRNSKIEPMKKVKLGFNPKPSPKEDEIIAEARRCIYCYDSPCSHCCPASLNVRDFVHAAAFENWYFASKVILTGNPMPLSTGNLCCVRNYCQGACNLANTLAGPIKTNEIQLYSVRQFRKYGIKPLCPPSIGKKVAIVGAGPSGLSCAAFLRRFGIDVTIYEKANFAGGLLMSELLPNRLPLEDIEFEIQMIKDMNVEFKFNQTLGKDFSIDQLLQEGYKAVYLAFGRPDDVKINFPCKGAISSHQFLGEICGVLKLKNGKKLPDYTGKRILILGAGETAVDCASAAARLGGLATIAFRKDFKGMRAYPYDVEELIEEGVEFLPLVQPVSIDNGEVKFQLQERTIDGKYNSLEEFITRKYDLVVTAFGATLDESKKLLPGEVEKSQIQKIEGYSNVFIGGDLANSVSVVEAVNDAKIAAKMIAEELGIKEDIPMFKTEVDNVSLEVELDGNKYLNPFGLAASPPSGTYECIRRAFKAGFGWCVTKTINLDKDIQRDNDFRITKCDNGPFLTNTYFNLCLQTELSCGYWLDAIKKLKQEFPDRIIIASICCTDNKEDWQWLVKKCLEVGADGFELALSCPNGAHGQSGNVDESSIGVSIGKVPEAIQRITEYVVEVANGKPVYPKLTPNVTEITKTVMGAIKAKANGITTINTVCGIPKFYPDGTPFPQVGTEKYIMSGGISGEGIRPIALRNISKVHNAFPDLHILGVGGVMSAYTALQHIYAGANIVEICTGIMRYSYEIIYEMISGLQFYLYMWSRQDLIELVANKPERRTLPHKDQIEKPLLGGKIPSLADIRGLGSKRYVERDKIQNTWTVKAKIDPDLCIGCGSCALSCRDNSTQAILKTVNGKWKVEESKCEGCGLCMSVCPVNAISFVRVEDVEWRHKIEGK